MYVRVYVCVRTWGRSAAKTLRHRSPEFAQSGFLFLPDLRGVRPGGFCVLVAAYLLNNRAAAFELFALESH